MADSLLHIAWEVVSVCLSNRNGVGHRNDRKMLLTSQVFFGRLYRDLAQKKLNLFELATGTMAQASAEPPQVMRCQFQDAHSFRILLDGAVNLLRLRLFAIDGSSL